MSAEERAALINEAREAAREGFHANDQAARLPTATLYRLIREAEAAPQPVTLDREEVANTIKNAIGYEPTLVSLAPGVGGWTHRTATDRDWLVETITDAVLALLVKETRP